MHHAPSKHRLLAVFALLCVNATLTTQSTAQSAIAQEQSVPTYADLAGLVDRSTLVVHATVRKQAEVSPERAPGIPASTARLYLEAETVALLAGSAPLGESLRYLVDLPRDTRGRAPKLKKTPVLLFAQPVAGSPGTLQLVAPDSQLAWSASLERRVRDILRESVAVDAPPQVTGVRDVLSIAGTVTGESETQLFLDTQDGAPASITVTRRPGAPAQWGVSWAEIVDQSATAPQPGTLEWYRLACFLPAQLPDSAYLSVAPADRARATADYRFVQAELGPCARTRRLFGS